MKHAPFIRWINTIISENDSVPLTLMDTLHSFRSSRWPTLHESEDVSLIKRAGLLKLFKSIELEKRKITTFDDYMDSVSKWIEPDYSGIQEYLLMNAYVPVLKERVSQDIQ